MVDLERFSASSAIMGDCSPDDPEFIPQMTEETQNLIQRAIKEKAYEFSRAHIFICPEHPDGKKRVEGIGQLVMKNINEIPGKNIAGKRTLLKADICFSHKRVDLDIHERVVTAERADMYPYLVRFKLVPDPATKVPVEPFVIYVGKE
jgi:hypothetical protein